MIDGPLETRGREGDDRIVARNARATNEEDSIWASRHEGERKILLAERLHGEEDGCYIKRGILVLPRWWICYLEHAVDKNKERDAPFCMTRGGEDVCVWIHYL